VAGLAWLVARKLIQRVRALARSEAGHMYAAGVWESWSVSGSKLAEALSRAARDRDGASRGAIAEVATLIDLAASKAAPIALAYANASQPVDKPGPWGAPGLAVLEPERRRAAASPLTTRVIYRAGTGAWSADQDVLSPAALNQLRELRDALTSEPRTTCRVIRVASGPSSRYAKSQVSAQLAWMLAESSQLRVLLMEADLDSPALHRMLRLSLPPGCGLSEQLSRLAGPDPTDSIAILRLAPGLHALVESRDGLPELLDSSGFLSMVKRQRLDHDVIVLDGPVVDTYADAQALRHIVDGVVFVVAPGARPSESMQLALSHFDKELILDLVMTST
jgi:Mrp family chromosome partitioning ATPase